MHKDPENMLIYFRDFESWISPNLDFGFLFQIDPLFGPYNLRILLILFFYGYNNSV